MERRRRTIGLRQRLRTGPSGGRERRGAAMIEMTLVLPLFLVLILGIVELGRAIMVTHLLTNAVRDGARRAAFEDATSESIAEAVMAELERTTNAGGFTVEVSTSGGDIGSTGFGDPITVTARVPFSEVSYGPAFILADSGWWSVGSVTLSSTCVMRREWD